MDHPEIKSGQGSGWLIFYNDVKQYKELHLKSVMESFSDIFLVVSRRRRLATALGGRRNVITHPIKTVDSEFSRKEKLCP
jgi:hypothetical protein